MKAAVIEHYGSANEFILKDLPIPVPEDNEVLIHIKARAVNPIDWKIRSGELRYIYPIRFPAILGFDLSGEITAMGKNVKNFKVGDSVYTCSTKKSGQAYAEYIALDESTLSLKPETMNFKQAASVPLAGMTALQALRDKGHIQARQKVLIIGASGGVGMFAVQIAKRYGAEVTAVCSTANVPFVLSLGADEVIDYKKETVFSKNKSYHIIFDCVAAHGFQQVKGHLHEHGVYISTLPDFRLIFQNLMNRFTSKQGKFILMKKNKDDLDTLTHWINTHELKTHIDSVFRLEDVALAHLRSETHHAVGKIIISS